MVISIHHAWFEERLTTTPVRTLTATTDRPHTWHSLTGEAARKTVCSESTVGLSRGRRAAKLPPPLTESTVKWKQCSPNSAKMSNRSPRRVCKPVRSARSRLNRCTVLLFLFPLRFSVSLIVTYRHRETEGGRNAGSISSARDVGNKFPFHY